MEKNPKKRKIRMLTTALIVFLVVAASFLFLGYGDDEVIEDEIVENGIVDDEIVGTTLPNPIIVYNTLEDLQAALPFTLSVPVMPVGYEAINFSTIAEDSDTAVGEVEYVTTDDEGLSTIMVTNRMGLGLNDIGGVYIDYPFEGTVMVGDLSILLKGSDEIRNLAIWNDGTYSYSIYAPDSNFTEDDLVTIIETID